LEGTLAIKASSSPSCGLVVVCIHSLGRLPSQNVQLFCRDFIMCLAYGFVAIEQTRIPGANDNGAWYSDCTIYHEQRISLMDFKLALSDHPARLRHDMVWYNGGIQQVYGLAVPIWLTILQPIGKILGYKMMPDRLALAIALSIMALAVLLTFPICASNNGSWLKKNQVVCMSGVVLIILLFPPFHGLLSTRLSVYEEAVAYEYIYGIIQFCLLVMHARTPSYAKYFMLCAMAGMGGFVRPTLVFYGLAAVATGGIVILLHRRHTLNIKNMAARDALDRTDMEIENDKKCAKHAKTLLSVIVRPLVVGCLFFVIGGGLLYCTNYLRFGNGFEFGHRLNLQDLPGSMYATRFDHPYQREPIRSATVELISLLFLNKNMNGGIFFKRNFFDNQSETTRWREIYLTAYDVTYLPLLMSGIIAGACSFRRLLSRRNGGDSCDDMLSEKDREIVAMALWGLISSAMLFGFYLRNSVISSRYLLDFMSGYAAIMVAGWLALCYYAYKYCNRKYILFALLGILCVWQYCILAGIRSVYGAPRFLSEIEAIQHLENEKNKERLPRPILPGYYNAVNNISQLYYPYNGMGWDLRTGDVKPLIILFLQDPEYLELIIRAKREDWERAVPRHVRAKVGLEELGIEKIIIREDGWLVRFRKPKSKRYQSGLQAAFITFVPNTRLADRITPWRLIRAQWKDVVSNEGTENIHLTHR